MSTYYISIPVVFELCVTLETDEDIKDEKQAHELALERLSQPDGFARVAILDNDGNPSEIAQVGEEVEMPLRIVSGNCLHVSASDTYFERED